MRASTTLFDRWAIQTGVFLAIFFSVTLCFGMSSHSEIRASISKPRGRHTATLFFLHGLGDVASGWFSELVHGAQQALPATLVGGLKIVCPQAPTRPITLNMGMKMPGWYDITSLSSRVADPCEGIDDSRKVLLSLIEAEINIHGIPPSRIIVGGFSQGAALSLYTGFQYPSQLGGIVALSGYLPKPEYLLKNLAPEAMSTPLFMGHGTADQIVRFEYVYHIFI